MYVFKMKKALSTINSPFLKTSFIYSRYTQTRYQIASIASFKTLFMHVHLSVGGHWNCTKIDVYEIYYYYYYYYNSFWELYCHTENEAACFKMQFFMIYHSATVQKVGRPNILAVFKHKFSRNKHLSFGSITRQNLKRRWIY